MDINLLVKLTARAWAVPILAQLHRGVPGRQAALLHATGAGRSAFGQSLDHLLELGLMARNTGHGHPLRPEYVLTDLGAAVAKRADQIMRASENSDGLHLIRRSWTLPVLAISPDPIGFNDMKAKLGTVTDRALSQSLQRLIAHDWMRRDVALTSDRPRPIYTGHKTGHIIGTLCAIDI